VDWPKALIWFNRSGENLGPFGDIGDSTLFIRNFLRTANGGHMRGLVGSADIWLQEGIRTQPVHISIRPMIAILCGRLTARAWYFASNRAGAYDLYEKAATVRRVRRLFCSRRNSSVRLVVAGWADSSCTGPGRQR